MRGREGRVCVLVVSLPAVVFDGGGQRLSVLGRRDDLQVVPQPLREGCYERRVIREDMREGYYDIMRGVLCDDLQVVPQSLREGGHDIKL